MKFQMGFSLKNRAASIVACVLLVFLLFLTFRVWLHVKFINKIKTEAIFDQKPIDTLHKTVQLGGEDGVGVFDQKVKANDDLLFLILGFFLSILFSFITYKTLKEKEQALALVQKKTEELQKSENSLRNLLDNSSTGISPLNAQLETELRLAASVFLNSYDGIVIANAGNQIMDVSPSFTRITGYSRSEVLGKTPKILSSGRHSRQFYKDMWDSINKYDFWSGEIWNRRKSGEIYPEMLSITVVRNKENQVQHYVGFFSDISAIKNHEATLIEARRQAEEATIAKSRFLATMSHEIRTPMNGILGMAQLLIMSQVQEAERIQYAQTIINSGSVLLTLLNDILDFSKVEAGKIELENTVISPKQIIEEIQLLFSDIARQKSLLLEVEWISSSKKEKLYLSDPHRLRQMLSNLVSNAIKFTLEGKIRIEVREIQRADQVFMLEFSVIDTGVGVPEDKLSRLFEPFSQVDSSTSRKYGGTGLGLSIVARMAKLMGGEFGVESVHHQGSRFWFSILAQPASDQQKLSYDQSQKESEASLQAQAMEFLDSLDMRVLVVDDDSVNRMVIDKFLRKLGAQSYVSENGHEALDLILKGEKFDLILMDLQMPIMDGKVTTQQIRKWEYEQNLTKTSIVAFTADAFEETKTSCLSVGMDGVLTKPVAVQRLQKLLTRVRSNRKRAGGALHDEFSF